MSKSFQRHLFSRLRMLRCLTLTNFAKWYVTFQTLNNSMSNNEIQAVLAYLLGRCNRCTEQAAKLIAESRAQVCGCQHQQRHPELQPVQKLKKSSNFFQREASSAENLLRRRGLHVFDCPMQYISPWQKGGLTRDVRMQWKKCFGHGPAARLYCTPAM